MAHSNYSHYYSKVTPVSLIWDSTLGAYYLKFENTYNWNELQGVISWIKQTIPWNERDYDPSSKVWSIHEKHIPALKILLENIKNFKLNYFEKPENQQSFSQVFVPLDVYKQTFKDLTGEELNETDYSISKHIYRRTCMQLHPDRNPNDSSTASKMSSLNEAWMNLEVKLFKVRELAKQEI